MPGSGERKKKKKASGGKKRRLCECLSQHAQWEDLWFVCLLRGTAKGGSFFDDVFGPLSGCLLSRHLQRTAAEALLVPWMSMSGPGLPLARSPAGWEVSSPPACARPGLRSSQAGFSNVGSHGCNGIIRGTANPLPALLSLGQLEGCGVCRQPAWLWVTWLPTG